MSETLQYKISICVVCMNRLHHLKQTIVRNIEDNADYDSLEFVLLNYNSTDGMDEWVKEELSDYIKSGRLVYYRTTEPEKWNPSHSKNIAFKLATGKILCNIWADYYTGQKFAHYLNDKFKENNKIVLTPIDFYKTKKGYSPPGDVLGKVCFRKSDFLKIRGFDEKLNKHGFEDYDFVNRLEMIGLKRVLIENNEFLKFIPHNESERYSLGEDMLMGIYVRYIKPHCSDLLVLFKNNIFFRGIIIDNTAIDSENPRYAYEYRNPSFHYTLEEDGWETGVWEKNLANYVLILKNFDRVYLTIKCNASTDCLVESSYQQVFFRLKDEFLIRSILRFKHFYETRRIMESNLINQNPIVNSAIWGKASVIKNFKKCFTS